MAEYDPITMAKQVDDMRKAKVDALVAATCQAQRLGGRATPQIPEFAQER